jgi:hypothetical protein
MLTNIMDAAGYDDREEWEIRYKRPVDDLNDYINRALVRGYADIVSKLDDDVRVDLMENLRSAFEPYREDGKVMMPNYARLGIGWKPV